MKELRVFLMCLKSCGPLFCLLWWATSLISRIYIYFCGWGGGGAFLIPGILFLVVVYSSLGFVDFTLETL